MEECLESPRRPGWGALPCWDRQLERHFPTSTLTGLPEASARHGGDGRTSFLTVVECWRGPSSNQGRYDTNTEQKDAVHPGKA